MDALKKEIHQFPLLYPIFLIFGIIIFFDSSSPLIYFTSLIITTLIALILITYYQSLYSSYIKHILKFFFCLVLGIFAMQNRLNQVSHPIFPYDNYLTKLKANITEIHPKEHGHKIILENISAQNLSLKETPKKIQLIVKTKINQVEPGDQIYVKAVISKPQKSYLANSYNYARDAYFKEIGATGFAVSDLKITIKNKNIQFKNQINRYRQNLQNKINEQLGNRYGSIITALMINEYQNITKEDLNNLRKTGLSHILSVSGMHLSLVVAIFFFTSRLILNMFKSLNYNLSIKKLAAIFALVGSMGYLLVSGMEVAAVRSFIMSSLILIAIMIDRQPSPMRSIASAAFVILLFNPENIKSASFQMSFAAVLGLISCYELLKNQSFISAKKHFFNNIIYYLISIIISSMVAGLATLPFVLYHFGQSANYSILANLIAVPLTSIILMPGIIMLFILVPLNYGSWIIYLLKHAVSFLLLTAEFFAKLPNSTSNFYKLNDLSFALIIFSLFFLAIWQTKIRYFSIISFAAAILLQVFTVKPDIFVDWDKKSLAIIEANQLIFLTKPVSKAKLQIILNYLGTKNIINHQNNDDITCDDQVCVLLKKQYQVKFYKDDFRIEILRNGKIHKSYKKVSGTDLIILS